MTLHGKFSQLVIIQGTMSPAGVGPLGLVNPKINGRIFCRTPYFPLLSDLMEMLISFSRKTWQVPALPIHALMTMVSVCTNVMPHREASGCCQKEDEEPTQKCSQAYIEVTWASAEPQADRLHAVLHKWCAHIMYRVWTYFSKFGAFINFSQNPQNKHY